VSRHSYFPRCWFAEVLGPPAGACDGQLVRAHLVPKQAVRREFPRGAYRKAEGHPWLPLLERNVHDVRTVALDGQVMPLDGLLWDERLWVPACGGPTGIGGHHGAYDCGRIAVPPEKLPPGLREYLAELGLEWMIERYFGTGRALTL
jgi:hypothetical protein